MWSCRSNRLSNITCEALGGVEASAGAEGGNGNGRMTHTHGVLDILRGGACSQNVTSEVSWIFRAIARDKGAKLTFVSDEDALVVDDSAVIGKHRGTRTAAALGGLGGRNVVHGTDEGRFRVNRDGLKYGQNKISCVVQAAVCLADRRV